MAGEGKLQKQIIEFLTPMRDVYFFNKWGNGVEEGGIPDLIMCVKGRFVGLELKNPNGSNDVDPRQAIHIKKIQRAGGYSTRVRSFQHFIKIFNSLYQ